MFPVTLCVTRLAGVGSDTFFMGVLRRAPPETSEGSNVVRFWSTAGGLIMCADSTVGDSFGLDQHDLVGQKFSNLCVDAEDMNRCACCMDQALTVFMGVVDICVLLR